jgi:hypothetical protein
MIVNGDLTRLEYLAPLNHSINVISHNVAKASKLLSLPWVFLQKKPLKLTIDIMHEIIFVETSMTVIMT